ncbi:MAG: D-alanyl-D-alanine carboxypeptidase [Alphaproteobacteria bacterium]|nr:D-alanyl-D-alanine carboxypeptidase [Alphaproteobacteria bacterium]
MIKKFLILLFCVFTTAVNADVFNTKAKSAYLFDYDSGTEIYTKNADILMPPSSMLKLMTLAVLFDEIKSGHIKMTDKFKVSENADYKNPFWYSASKMCLVTGQKISVQDVILAIIVLSAGDASVVVAENIAGNESKFTELMQKKAQEIGIKQSSFGNASGLPNEKNLMTSRELGKLAKYIIDEYPDIYPMFATKKFEFEETQTKWCSDWVATHTLNYNKLLFNMAGADGLKTGHTEDGGYGMVASAKVGGRRLIGVINGFHGKGHDALAEEMKKMLNHAYKNTHNKIFYRANDTITKIPVWYGVQPEIEATTNENVAITLPKEDSFKSVRVLARYDTPVVAPIKQGQQIGEIVIEKNGDIMKRIPLVAKNKVRKIQFFGRVLKNISVMIWGR